MAKVELLSPGGSLTGIKAAVAAGADAVYAGGSLARAHMRRIRMRAGFWKPSISAIFTASGCI